MKDVFSYLRIKEWLDSKVAFMLGILLYVYFCMNAEFENVLKKTIAYLLFVSMFLAVSYVSNDLADLEIDKRAGKKKVIANMPRWLIGISLISMVVIGNAMVLLCAENEILCAALILLIYFMGLAYSTLGIRFKERGIWGLMECSFAQRSMPLFMIYALLKIDNRAGILLLGWIILSFIDGLRYILIHQIQDFENDVAAGVHTYVTNKNGNYRKLIIGCLIAEIGITLGLLIPLWMEKFFLTTLFVLFNFGLEYCIYVVIQKYAGKDLFLTYDSVPMEGFYNALFPILTGVCMTCMDVRWIGVLLIVIVICFKALLVKCKIAAIYVASKVKKRK